MVLILAGSGSVLAQQIYFTDQTVLESSDIKIPAAPKSAFKYGDGIYGFASLRTPVVETTINGENPSNSVNLGYFVKVNGEPLVSNRVGRFAAAVPGAMFSKSLAGGEMYEDKVLYLVLMAEAGHPRLNVTEVSGPGQELMKGLAKAGVGSHKVDVEIRYMFQNAISEPLAKGSFTVVVDKLPNIDLSADLPAAKMNDPALVKTMVTALRTGGWKYQVLKINIVSPNWTIHREPLGKITHRTIDTYTAFKMDDGTCKAFNLSFRQDYYTNAYHETQTNGTGDSFEISCAKVGAK